jgi:hypothetical protein
MGTSYTSLSYLRLHRYVVGLLFTLFQYILPKEQPVKELCILLMCIQD